MRADEGLLVQCHGLVGIEHIERRHGANLQLLAVVAGYLAALLDGALLGLHIFIRLHESPIDRFHLGDGVHDLLAERRVRNAPVVLRLVHEALIHPDAGSVEQVLRHLGIEAGAQLRAEERGAVGIRGVDIVEGKLECCTCHETLVVSKVIGVRPGLSTCKEAGGWTGGAINLDGR